MNAVIDKRCYNTEEAMAYLGVKRRSFEQHIAPRCRGVKIGTSKIWEKSELDAAWEQYKIDAGSERPSGMGETPWDVKPPASTKQRLGMKLISSTKASAFDSVASAILNRPRHG